MTSVNPSMRPKVKGDTFFLPDAKGSVYFRNNVGSFRMEGSTISDWVEQLIPLFNGEHTLEDLTNGLSDAHRQRVFEIAEVLQANGFVRDVSQDLPHSLPESVQERYAYQIEFLDNMAGSGASRFQSYREAKVLAVGAGSFFVALESALLESGLQKVSLGITDATDATDAGSTDRARLKELEAHVRKADPQMRMQEVPLSKHSKHSKQGEIAWNEIVQPFDWVLYVSEQGDVEELMALQAACQKEKKGLLPALCVRHVGLAGPLVHPDSDGCWESVWRRLHETAFDLDPQAHAFSSTAAAMLANLLVFELMQTIGGVIEPRQNRKFCLLNLETLEGAWHGFNPHPAVRGWGAVKEVSDFQEQLELQVLQPVRSLNTHLYSYFAGLTSKEAGIFHLWEEGDVKQLPLSMCRVQAVDPLSAGPATLLPVTFCSGLTHEEARLEAGFTGLEAYASRLATMHAGTLLSAQTFVGVGAGMSLAEGVARGLQKCLEDELSKSLAAGQEVVVRLVEVGMVEDERCRYYLQALTTMQGAPLIGLGQDVCGFPVVWVGSNDSWHGSVGVNVTIALRKALQQALMKAQNEAAFQTTSALTVPYASFANQDPEKDQASTRLNIPASAITAFQQQVLSALPVLKQSGKRLVVYDLALEPFFKGELAGVYGVLLREEESQ